MSHLSVKQTLTVSESGAARNIRRKKQFANDNVTDLEMASLEVISNGKSATIHSEETEFMLDSKSTDGPLMERARASKSADGGQMSRD